MMKFRIATIIIAGLAMFIGMVLGASATQSLYSPNSEGELILTTCASHGGLAQALGTGLGTNQHLGVECRDHFSFSISVEGPSLPVVHHN